MQLGPRAVTDPSGVEWTVRRVWVSRRLPRLRRIGAEMDNDNWWSATDWMPWDLGSADGFEWFIAAIAVIVLLVFVVVPLLLFGIELIILGAAIAAGVLGRMLLGRPWVIEAHNSVGEVTRQWEVSGWRRSERHLDEIAQAISSGSHAP